MWGATAPVLHPRLLVEISIHAPRVGSDEEHRQLAHGVAEFQSTLPVWGATIEADTEAWEA